MYDFSDYPKNHPWYDVSNKKVIGKFKDESSSKIITEFAAPKIKMYSFKTVEYVRKTGKRLKRL